MKVVRIQHVSVNAQGRLAEVRDFYRDVFGLDDAVRPNIPGVDGHWFALGGGQLHLVDAAPLGSAVDPIGDHWCVEVEDLDAARTELIDKGVAFVEGGQGDVTQIWLADPVGRTIELQQARP